MQLSSIVLPGPWQVMVTGAPDPEFYYIYNTQTGRTKKVGPVRSKRVRYLNRAFELADARNRAAFAAVDGILKFEGGEMEETEFIYFMAGLKRYGYLAGLQGHYQHLYGTLVNQGYVDWNGYIRNPKEAAI